MECELFLIVPLNHLLDQTVGVPAHLRRQLMLPTADLCAGDVIEWTCGDQFERLTISRRTLFVDATSEVILYRYAIYVETDRQFADAGELREWTTRMARMGWRPTGGD